LLSSSYRILGLSPSVSTSELKRRYRRLAMRYHPDKPEGDLKTFLAIQKAYEQILSSRKTNQRRHDTRTYVRSYSRTSQESMRRKRAYVYREYMENEQYYQRLLSGFRWKIMHYAAFLGVLVALVISVDIFLPYRYEPDRIVGYDKAVLNGFDYRIDAIRKTYTQNGRAYYSELIPNVHAVESDVLVAQTYILRNDMAYIPLYKPNGELVNLTSKTNYYAIQFTLGSHPLLLLPIFLLPLLIVLFPRKLVAFTFFYFIAIFLSCPLMVYYLLSHDRWIHLITLGFL